MLKNRLLINIFSNWANLLILIIVRFFLTPFFIHKLGDVEYGIWVLILSVVGYMQLLNLGINTAIVRYFSKFVESKDYQKANEIFNTALCMFLVLAVLIVMSILILAVYMPYFYDFSGNLFYKIIFIVVGINLAFEFVFYAFSAVLSAKQKFLEMNIVETSSFLIGTGFIVIALIMGYKLLAIAIIQICTNLVRGTILSFYSMKITPEIKFHFSAVKRDTFKKIFSYTLYNLLMKVSARINLTGSILIIGYFLSTGAVTFYAIATNLINYLHSLIMQMQRVLIPRFSQLEAQNENKQIQEHFLALTRYTLIIAIPIIFIFVYYGDAFIELWIGNKYAALSGKILAILAIGKIFQISQLSTETALKGISKHKNLSFIRIAESAAVIVLSLVLVKKYELIGVAYATTIPMIFFNLLIIPVYTCNLLKISLVRYYVKYIFKNVLAILPLVFIYYYLDYPINSYSVLGLSVVCITILFFVLSFILILDFKERKLIYSIFGMSR